MDHIVAGPTLSHVIAQHQQAFFLTPQRRRDLISGVRRMSQIIGIDPGSTPASLPFLPSRINAVLPAKYDLTPKTWSTLRSNFRAALIEAAPRQVREGHPEWERLRAPCPTSA